MIDRKVARYNDRQKGCKIQRQIERLQDIKIDRKDARYNNGRKVARYKDREKGCKIQ